MRGATLFSGIGAPEQAMPGWDWLWSAEIEAFPSAVHAMRHGSPNLGDVTAPDFVERALACGRPDILVFGSPCQSFSQAGRRLGLDDPRGNLALVALGVARRIRPRWIVFENVPGLLSIDDGGSFAAFQQVMEECGYYGAWRVLDASYWGLAQRRARVFFVGYLGDWRPPAAVLFEPESLRRHSSPRGQAREDIAGTLEASADWSRNEPGAQIVAFGGNNTSGPVDVATACKAHGSPHERQDFESDTFVVFDPLDTKGGAAVAFALRGREGGAQVEISGETTGALRTAGGGASHPMVYRTAGDGAVYEGGDRAHALPTGTDPFSHIMGGEPGQGVRRLTPREWERLQGFPDDYTLIPWRRGQAADAPRYKSLGNSMAVPVMHWLLSRIERVDAIVEAKREAA